MKFISKHKVLITTIGKQNSLVRRNTIYRNRNVIEDEKRNVFEVFSDKSGVGCEGKVNEKSLTESFRSNRTESARNKGAHKNRAAPANLKRDFILSPFVN